MDNSKVISKMLFVASHQDRPAILNAAFDANLLTRNQFVDLCWKFGVIKEDHYVSAVV